MRGVLCIGGEFSSGGWEYIYTHRRSGYLGRLPLTGGGGKRV